MNPAILPGILRDRFPSRHGIDLQAVADSFHAQAVGHVEPVGPPATPIEKMNNACHEAGHGLLAHLRGSIVYSLLVREDGSGQCCHSAPQSAADRALICAAGTAACELMALHNCRAINVAYQPAEVGRSDRENHRLYLGLPAGEAADARWLQDSETCMNLLRPHFNTLAILTKAVFAKALLRDQLDEAEFSEIINTYLWAY